MQLIRVLSSWEELAWNPRPSRSCWSPTQKLFRIEVVMCKSAHFSKVKSQLQSLLGHSIWVGWICLDDSDPFPEFNGRPPECNRCIWRPRAVLGCQGAIQGLDSRILCLAVHVRPWDMALMSRNHPTCVQFFAMKLPLVNRFRNGSWFVVPLELSITVSYL